MSLKKIFISLACLGVFAFCISPASAMTVDELQAKIAELMAQITQLQQQLAQQTGTTTWCHTFVKTIKFKDTGSDVVALKTALKNEGLLNISNPTTFFGLSTQKAVIAFQEKYASDILTPWNLAKGSGYVGTGTIAKLNRLYGCKTACVSTPTCAEGYEPVYVGIDSQGCKSWICTLSTTKSLTLTSPNGGEKLVAGNTYDITWKASGIKYVNIYLSGTCETDINGMARCSAGCPPPTTAKCSAGCGYVQIFKGIAADLGKYSWTIPTTQSLWTDATIKIEEDVSDRQNQTCLQDSSNNVFSIVSASTTCISEGNTGIGFNSDKCCAGLTSITNSFGNQSTGCIAPNNGSFVCTKCGNGICGVGENKCNCSQDCTANTVTGFQCKDMGFYAKYFAFSNGKLSMNSTYTDLQKNNWIKSATEGYGYLGNIKIDYNINCTKLTYNECKIFQESNGYKNNPELNCDNLEYSYLCKEERSMFPPGSATPSVYNPYFINGDYGYNQDFLLVVEAEHTESTIPGGIALSPTRVTNTICAIPLEL